MNSHGEEDEVAKSRRPDQPAGTCCDSNAHGRFSVEDEICRCLYELLSNVQLEGFRIKLGNRWIGRRIR